jgi:hypothetical protein
VIVVAIGPLIVSFGFPTAHLRDPALLLTNIDFGEGAITSTSEALSEPKMRAYLKKAGASEKDINTWIEQARNYPDK